MYESHPPEHARRLDLTGAFNFRDLGGYQGTDGRIVRWGRLFRSDSLHELTEADVAVLREAGLASVIDLRTPTEAQRIGRGLLAGESLYYVNLSVTQQEGGESTAAPTEFQADLADRYMWYLDVGAASLVSAMEIVADPARAPVVFHCAAGKDRTGVLAALLLDVLGVDRETIVEDYALTGPQMKFVMERLRRDPLVGERVDELPPHLFAVDPVTMRRFLELLSTEYGGAYQWALDAGVSKEALESLSELYLTSDT